MTPREPTPAITTGDPLAVARNGAHAPDSVLAIGSGSSLSREFEALYASVRRLSLADGSRPRLVGITSCRRGAGVSTVAINLALAATHDIEGLSTPIPIIRRSTKPWQQHLNQAWTTFWRVTSRWRIACMRPRLSD